MALDRLPIERGVETAMKTQSHARIIDPDPSWVSLTAFPEDMMLAVIGHDLRHLYDEVTDAAQPDDLMRLALTIDARRALETDAA